MPAEIIIPGTTAFRKAVGEDVRKERDRVRKAASRAKARAERPAPTTHLAVLDFETEPFDNTKPEHRIDPFLAVLMWGDGDDERVVIHDENPEHLITRLVAAIEALPDKFTIYAHNGGRFDYMFLASRIRGEVAMKGRSLMSFKIGAHELRDSMHIIPTKLADAGAKEKFDYMLMARGKRHKHMDAITRYCIQDCRVLLDIARHFVNEHGLKISIGQAAMAELREAYPEVKRIHASVDAFFRPFFFGGRVECLQGRVHIKDRPLRVYDVNSMYPAVMANYAHPIDGEFLQRKYVKGIQEPNENTIFLTVKCRNNGALIGRDPETGATSANIPYGIFRTTIWEFRTALKYGRISDVKILAYYDFKNRSTFEKFVLPRYEKRKVLKLQMADMAERGLAGTPEYAELEKDDLIIKLVLNNAYGKFAQDPSRYKDYYFTAPDEVPVTAPGEAAYEMMTGDENYTVWARPSTERKFYNNVATAASITGAARAVLLEAICLSEGAIYCDTDSLVCTTLNAPIDAATLGAWKFEGEFDEAIIAGKKMYYLVNNALPEGDKRRAKKAMKGVRGLTYNDYVALYNDEAVETVSPGVTLSLDGSQEYKKRKVRSTVEKRDTQCQRQASRHSTLQRGLPPTTGAPGLSRTISTLQEA